MTEKIFPDIESIDNYIKRYYAIMEYLKYNKNFLWKYVDTGGESVRTLREHYGVVYPIRPMKHSMQYFPIGITNQGEIICLPNFDICPSMMIYGSKRTGKSTFMERIVEYFYWWRDYAIFIGNDYQNEVYAWARPCRSNEFYKQFKTFGEKPASLPIFLIIPNSKNDLGIEDLETPKLRISFPLKYLIEHIQEFVNLEKSEPYFKRMNFDGCKSEEEIKERIFKSLEEQGVEKKLMKGILPKINNVMELFFDDGMLSFDKRVIEKITMDNDNTTEAPIAQLLKCNVIPTLITTQIKSKWWFSHYFKCIFDQIIEYKQENRKFKEKSLLIVVDELNKILVDKKIVDSVGTSIAQGGMLNIGFLGAAHHPSEINITISGNCKYVFCFNMNDKADINKVKKDYNLTTSQAKLISELKQFEFIAKSKEMPFIIYDIKNNNIHEEDFVHGFIIPPRSHHLPPASSKKYYFSSRLSYEKYGGRTTSNQAKKIIIENNIMMRNPKNGNLLLDVCVKKDNMKFAEFKINIPRLIEGIDYSRAYWRLKLNQASPVKEVEYDFVKNSGIMVYKKNKKYFLCYIKEAMDDFIQVKTLPDDIIIQYNPFFKQFRLLQERGDIGWYPSKERIRREYL